MAGGQIYENIELDRQGGGRGGREIGWGLGRGQLGLSCEVQLSCVEIYWLNYSILNKLMCCAR